MTGGGPVGPFSGFGRRTNLTHEPKRSTRHSEVLPFRAQGAVAKAKTPCTSTLALPTSPKAGRGRTPSRHRRVNWPFRIGLIGQAYPDPGGPRTPWDFIGAMNVP